MTMDDTAPATAPLSVAAATEAYERSVKRRAKAALAVKDAESELAMANRALAADYRAFLAAVDTVRPKRPRKAKAEGAAP